MINAGSVNGSYISPSTPGASTCSFLMKFSDLPFINALKMKSPPEFDIVPSHINKAPTRRQMSEVFSFIFIANFKLQLFKIQNPIPNYYICYVQTPKKIIERKNLQQRVKIIQVLAQCIILIVVLAKTNITRFA